ncbi:SDR family oxidoreductase [Aeromicrobium alkaliterrae]|uniref:SDR family oxidoreductase n=1 Tax=Aeromicrobium alkaliterrae TaxID=302168 RepID=A0ABN2K7K0_9ACTN
MSPGFTGRVVAVTGAGGGIGSATARAFSAAGATVVGLDLTEGELPDGVSFLRCDVTDDATVAAAFSRLASEHGRLDVLVNNSGVPSRGTVETATDAEWLRVFEINVFGLARVSRHALPLIRATGSGSIVNVASVNAVAGTPLRAVYSASKGAVAALTRAMAADLLEEGIRVNAVHPGPVLTAGTGRNDDDREAAIRLMEASQPLGHMIDVDEIADAIVYLARPSNRSLTGAELLYDGSHVEVVNVGTR